LLLFGRGRVAFRRDDTAAGMAVGGWRDRCDIVGWWCWARVWVRLLFLFGAGLGWMHLSLSCPGELLCVFDSLGDSEAVFRLSQSNRWLASN
jgi:hypothetical protein